jgi:hypothetical protein
MAKQSISDVVVTVLESSESPMTAKEIYDSIVAKGLYEFKAKDPFAILRAQLNKHCIENQSRASSPRKLFTKSGDKYGLC